MSGFVDSFKKGKSFGTQEDTQIVNIPIASIKTDPNQVRKHFDDGSIEELAVSIKARGIQNPVHVRPSVPFPKEKARGQEPLTGPQSVDSDQWVIITGERRYRAATKAELTSIPAICHPATVTEQEIRTLQMIENLQREDLTTMEIVRGFQSMAAMEMSQTEIIATLGTPKATVSKIFAIMKQIQEDWLKVFEEICYKGQNIPVSRLYEIAREENSNRQKAMYSALLQEYKYQAGDSKTEPEKNEEPQEEKKSKKERFNSDQVWDCLKRLAKKDKEEILKYIPTNKLEKLLEEYSRD